MAIQYCSLLGNTIFVPNSEDTFIHSGCLLFIEAWDINREAHGNLKEKEHTL